MSLVILYFPLNILYCIRNNKWNGNAFYTSECPPFNGYLLCKLFLLHTRTAEIKRERELDAGLGLKFRNVI